MNFPIDIFLKRKQHSALASWDPETETSPLTRVKIFLVNICFSLIKKSTMAFRFSGLTTSSTDQWSMFVPLQNVPKERTQSNKNHLVSLYLLTILTGQGHISELLVLPQVSKCQAGVFSEAVPLQS